MKISTLFITVFFISSCATTKWKHHYISAQNKKFAQKYSTDGAFSVKASDKTFINKPFNKLSRSDVKKNIKNFEKILALIPDSVQYNSANSVDSFYRNKNKIKYIIKHKLQTDNIYLLKSN